MPKLLADKVTTLSLTHPVHYSSYSLNTNLAYGDTVLLELLRQDGVEERVAARVEGQDEDGEDLGLLQGDQVEARARRQGEEGDGGPETI